MIWFVMGDWMFFKKEEMDVVYPVDFGRAKKVFGKLLGEQDLEAVASWDELMYLSEKFYFYFVYNNSIEPSRYKVFLKDFYGMMKNLPSQNIMIDSLEINNKQLKEEEEDKNSEDLGDKNCKNLDGINFDSLDFKKDSMKSKIIKDFKINTENDVFSYFKKEFCKTKLNLNFNQVYEKFQKEYSEIVYEYDYKENFKNDSSIWIHYNNMQKKKFNLQEKNLIKRDFDYDTFEEEKEYMMKVEEVYREFYEYK